MKNFTIYPKLDVKLKWVSFNKKRCCKTVRSVRHETWIYR